MLVKRYTAPPNHPIFDGCRLSIVCDQGPRHRYLFTTAMWLKTEHCPDGILIFKRLTNTLECFTSKCIHAGAEGWQLVTGEDDLDNTPYLQALAEGVFDPIGAMDIALAGGEFVPTGTMTGRVYPAGTKFTVHLDCGTTKSFVVSSPMDTWDEADQWAHREIDAINEEGSYDPTDEYITYRIVPSVP